VVADVLIQASEVPILIGDRCLDGWDQRDVWLHFGNISFYLS
jgi:hypothetical protein